MQFTAITWQSYNFFSNYNKVEKEKNRKRLRICFKKQAGEAC